MIVTVCQLEKLLFRIAPLFYCYGLISFNWNQHSQKKMDEKLNTDRKKIKERGDDYVNVTEGNM